MEKQEHKFFMERGGIRLVLVFPEKGKDTDTVRWNVKNILLSELKQQLQKQGDCH